jgi:CRISPR/Cas system-associated endoribonuclease Cas2
MVDLLNSFLEVKLSNPEDFLKIKETLTRIGVASRKDNKLFQSCHILHKQSKYYIVSFKELFALDGKLYDFSDEDRGRRNTIAFLLQDWGLIKIINENNFSEPRASISQIKIISHKEKGEWELIPKYTIGRKKNNVECI